MLYTTMIMTFTVGVDLGFVLGCFLLIFYHIASMSKKKKEGSRFFFVFIFFRLKKGRFFFIWYVYFLLNVFGNSKEVLTMKKLGLYVC